MDIETGTETRTPLGPLTPAHLNGEKAGALDFSKLTASQFGITSSSFTASFPKDKDKSRVAQLKARRRSTIGVRGSPETNSLICYRARQAMKTPPRTPQHLLESPLFSGRDSIKQKMAAFQRLMGTDEENTQRSESLTEEGKEEGEGAGHAQSDVDGGSEERENRLVPVTPPLSKRRRRGTPHRSMWEEPIEEEEALAHTSNQEPQVEFKSPRMAPGLGSDSQSQLMSLPMLSKPELIKTGDVEVSCASKKKRVRFGAPLSPEFFDKNLPPSTPLQKGATPARLPSSTGRKHSLLKTPQRFEPPLPQPDFGSPERNGASPVLSARTHGNGGEDGDEDEVFVHNQKISFLIMDEEFDDPPKDTTASAENSELAAHHEPLTKYPETTDSAFQEDEEMRLSVTVAPDHPTEEPELKTEQEVQHEPLKTPESPAGAPRPRGRKRKQPAEPEVTETRRSSRSAAESAKGRMKTSSAKKRFGSKEVDRSLYGKRDYASKNPLLSPIIEAAGSSLNSTPVQPHTGRITPATDENSDSCPAPARSTKQSNSAPREAVADLVAAAALWRRRFLRQNKDGDSDTDLTVRSDHAVLADAPVQSEVSAESSVVPADKKASAGRGVGRRRNSASRRQSWSGAKDEPEVREQKTELHPSGSNPQAEEQGEQLNQSTKRKPKTIAPSGGRQRGRRSGRINKSSVVEEEGEVEDGRGLKRMCEDMVESSASEREEVEKKDESVKEAAGHDVAEKNDENVREAAGHEEGEKKNNKVWDPPSAPLEILKPWQQPDFCIEDVLKPVAKSRGSVRRSLRNRRSMDVLAKGLAWVEHASPQMITATQRRRTRGRLSAVSQPPLFPESEETQSDQ